MILAQCRVYNVNQWDKIEDPNINVSNYSHLILTKMPKAHIGKKKVPSTNSAGIPHVEK